MGLRYSLFSRLPSLLSSQYIGLYVLNCPFSSLGDRLDISITHLIIIIKLEVSTFPLLSYFSVVACLRRLYHHMLVAHIFISRESWVLCFYNCAVLWYGHIIEYINTQWSYSSICVSHYFIIIIIHTYLKVLNPQNACRVHSVSSLSLRLSQFS